MKKLLLLSTILFVLYCGNRSNSNEKVYLPNMKFKRTQNPNYSNYFPSSKDTIKQNSNRSGSSNNINTLEPLPSFKSEAIANSPNHEEKTSGFFASLFGVSESENQKSEAKICSELLNINKTVLYEQNNKLKSIKNDKKKLIDEINSLERKYQHQKIQDQHDNQQLKMEIDRLHKLIKILSTELK